MTSTTWGAYAKNDTPATTLMSAPVRGRRRPAAARVRHPVAAAAIPARRLRGFRDYRRRPRRLESQSHFVRDLLRKLLSVLGPSGVNSGQQPRDGTL
jgi:hypothetical protein